MSQFEALPLRCPCCRHKTLGERGAFEICPVCFWEDDGQDDEDADTVRGDPNSDLSLTQGRANFQLFGASREQDLPHIRAPLPHEL
jgi:hypothetical protein